MTSAPQPLFDRAFQDISGRIESGELPPGARLPSERWFAQHLGVSRTTVRRAIEELLDGGLVEPARGGLVVARPAPPDENRLLTLTEIALARGFEPTSRVRLATTRPATLDEADVLGVAPGSELFDLVRVRMLDGLEICVDHDRVLGSVLPNAVDLDFTHVSLYGSIEAAGTVLAEARAQIEACGASAEEAAELDLEPGAPLLVATEELVDDDGRVICLSRTAYRSDRHRFLTTYTRRPQRSSAERPSTRLQQGAA